MKTEIVIIIGFVTALICTGAVSYQFGVKAQEERQEIIERHIENASRTGIELIWNDDEESIPMEGEIVKIEMIIENTVYVSPINQ
jgi:hypothetical protein